jgi:L-seryl-tRNA(Ser) seleniumtransferase
VRATYRDDVMADPRRRVPRTDAVLADPRLVAAADRLGSALVKETVVAAQGLARQGRVDPEAVADLAVASLPASATTMRPVINATGVVLHTNLGRAPLGPSVLDALAVASGYVDVEWDVVTGGRAGRGRGTLDALLARVPAAEAAYVVNNGAAALVLVAAALAGAGEVVVSRGELVEIGDGFRLPDLLAATGARLREVGTTNRTTLADYAAAVDDTTSFVLKVHPSNFVIRGFTSSVDVAALTTLGVPVVVDIGSGLLAPHPAFPEEPDAATVLREGAAVVTCSGDKLLGGPQAGLLLGRSSVIETVRRHPLARALRVDKLTLAALEATLRGPRSVVADYLDADPRRLQERAEAVATELRASGVAADVVASVGVVGGGGAPGVELPGWAVAVAPTYAERLRGGRPCVAARVVHDRCLLDLRCVPEDSDVAVVKAVLAV